MDETVSGFSGRLGVGLAPHPLYTLLLSLQDSGADVLDLTISNPTTAGIPYDSAALRHAFAGDGYLAYSPDPKGNADVRERIAAAYAQRGCSVSPEHIHLTASSSEAYSWLFKMLGDPGNVILSPRPAYPLFEDLAALEGLRLRPYTMKYLQDGGWRLDRLSLEMALCAETRAVLAVHPANPTGAYVHDDDMAYLLRFCDEHELALIVDEVFYDFHLQDGPQGQPALAGSAPRLLFVLNGFSKMLGLPQMKLGWIVTSGRENVCAVARARLDHIADTYLSVSGPVQAAASALLATEKAVQHQIRARCKENLAILRSTLLQSASYSLLPPEGGWSAVLRLETGSADEDIAYALLRDRHVRVHTGTMFDFPFGQHLVLSLLTAREIFQEGVARLSLS